MNKFVIKRSKDNQFYFVLVANNGEVILTSETYKRKRDSVRGVRAVRRAVEFGFFSKKANGMGDFYFRLYPRNYRIVGISQMYNSREAVEKGIEAVRRYAPTAPITFDL